jgi:hypothetical protein
MLDGNITKRQLLDLFDQFETRTELLDDKSKSLVRLFQTGGKFKPLADNCGVNQATIMRRLKKIAQRISDDKFIQAVVSSGGNKIVKEKFINKKSIRQIVNETGLTKYKVGKIINRMRDNLKLKIEN